MTLHQLSDSELVELYAGGNEKCLEILIIRHQQKVFSFIYKKVKNQQLAEDLLQDIFIKVINSVKTIRYQEQGKFQHWIMRIARNHMLDYFRDSVKMKTYSGTEDFDIFDVLVIPEAPRADFLDESLNHRKLKRFIYRLPREMREVVLMRTCFDMSFNEIAAWQQVGLNTALGRMHNAIKHLKKMYLDSDEMRKYSDRLVQ